MLQLQDQNFVLEPDEAKPVVKIYWTINDVEVPGPPPVKTYISSNV